MTNLALVFLTVSQAFSLPPGLLSSVCYVESAHVVMAINHKDGGSPSFGICQIKFDTAKLMGYGGDEFHLRRDAMANAYYAGKYLSYQIDRYDGDLKKAVAAYNSGTYKENEYGNPINHDYIKKVFKSWAERW